VDNAIWKSLIPHQGAMALLDSVVGYDEERIECTSASHRSAENPLRSAGQLHALHLCEYGAQAMAVHGALLAHAAGARAKPGFLVSLRGVKLDIERIDDLPGDLRVTAEKLIDSGASWQYAFRVEHAGRLLAEGRAAVIVAGDKP
jgi:predicted hotdog family 3-hydroxylacyl-ACP dehydratase